MIEYIHEPTDLQCGQAVLAMVLGKTVEEIVIFLQNDRETTLAEMKRTFREHGVHISDERIAVQKKEQLPPLCLLSLETRLILRLPVLWASVLVPTFITILFTLEKSIIYFLLLSRAEYARHNIHIRIYHPVP